MTKEFLHNLGVLPIGIEKRPKRAREGVIGHMLGDLGSLERRFAVVWPSRAWPVRLPSLRCR
jgi:hypothetical protein